MKLRLKHYGFILGLVLTIIFIGFMIQEIPEGCFSCFMGMGVMWIIFGGIALLMALLGINILVLKDKK